MIVVWECELSKKADREERLRRLEREIRESGGKAMSNYVKKIVSDYCVLDTETTGLSAYYDEVIEIGILKVRSGDVTDRYEQLIRPKYEEV